MSMELERTAAQLIEFQENLNDFADDPLMSEEFLHMHDLGDFLFAGGKIFQKPELLMKLNVEIRQDGVKIPVTGTIQGIERSPEGELTAILIKDAMDPKKHSVVPFNKNTTHINIP